MRPRLYLGCAFVVVLAFAQPVSALGVWSVSPSAAFPGGGELDGVASSGPRDAWAVGFARDTGPINAIIERWNGAQWSLVPTPATGASPDSRLHAVAVATSTAVWAVGSQIKGSTTHSLIERWNGQAWSIAPGVAGEPSGAELLAVAALSASNVWAVGDLTPISGGGTIIEHWDGVRWSVVPGASLPITESARLLGVAGASSTDVWAVGAMGRHPNPVIEHWNGTVWSLVNQPVHGYDSTLSAVSVLSTKDVWAVGSQNLTHTVTEHWDGTSWKLIASPSPTASSANALTAVAALGPSDVWGAGVALFNSSTDRTLTEHWDGTHWSLLATPDPGSAQNALYGLSGSGPGSPLWAVGLSSSSTARPLILRAAG